MSLKLGTTQIAGLNTNAHSLFDFKWSDHLQNDMSWLRADTFSWQDGTVYSNAYNKLVSEYNNGTAETVGGITYKRTTNGFKIADASQESAILSKYNTDGIAWFYILDTTNQRFKLPRTKWGFKGLRGNVGDGIAQTVLLPSITGAFRSWTGIVGSFANGAFVTESGGTTTGWGGGNENYVVYNFDASRSSSVYSGDGTNTLIDEKATQMYLYFYVGEFAQTAIEQTAGITSEQLNAKVDKSDCYEINPMIVSYINGSSGYNIWANGYCEQWGYISGGTVTFLKTFADTNYIITTANRATNGGYPANYMLCVSNITTTGFTKDYLGTGGGSGTYLGTYWKASGYLAEGEY